MAVTLVNGPALLATLSNYKAFQRKLTSTLSPISPVEELAHLAKQSSTVLFTASTLFPLDLFPDTISIDENKVTITRRNFFGVANIHSILISDITDVTVDTCIIYASLHIVDSSNYRFPIMVNVNTLRIKDALEVRRLIQGLIATKRDGITLSTIEEDMVRKKIRVVGNE